MIYGYPRHTDDEETSYELREVSFAMPPDMLRRMAKFILKAADDVEADDHLQAGWHFHARDTIPDWWQKSGGHDVVICAPLTVPRLLTWSELPGVSDE
jgi:hypothetical protein